MLANAAQTFAVILIVAAAAGYLILFLRRSAKGKRSCCCGPNIGLLTKDSLGKKKNQADPRHNEQ